MEELLTKLEFKLKHLANAYRHLEIAYQDLHRGSILLSQEKKFLLAKQQRAIVQIESLVNKLKSLNQTEHQTEKNVSNADE